MIFNYNNQEYNILIEKKKTNKNTYIRVNDRYKDCKFEYEGWIKWQEGTILDISAGIES